MRSRDHERTCPHYYDPLGVDAAIAQLYEPMTSPKLSQAALTFRESEQRQASRHVSTMLALSNDPYPPIEINLGVGATQFEDRAWPAPMFFLDTRQPLSEGQFAALADAVRQLFAAYRERFGG